jgi:signal transduction histidine kinase/CheY-like chemotaxis protein
MVQNPQTLRLPRLVAAFASLVSSLRHFETPVPALRLRTKFLLSVVLVIVALTFSTLVIVGRAAEEQVQRAVEQDTRNSVLTFQNIRAERQLELNRQAEIFSTLPAVKALMAGDSADLQNASEEVWHSTNLNLFALSDWKGRIVALHTTSSGFSTSVAEQMFSQSHGGSESGGWWFGAGRLYQVALRPVELGSPDGRKHLGTVIVGREIDSQVARDVGHIALCQISFRYGDRPVVSSFSVLDEQALSSGILRSANAGGIEIEKRRYLFSTVNLTPAMQPPLTLTVLKPGDEALASITQLNHQLMLLGFFSVLLSGALVFLISHTFTRPLEQLVEGVHALEQGNFVHPLGPDTGDEVSQVTAAFDRMRTTLRRNEEEQRQLGDRLRQAQKMEAVGRLAGGIAHDFNNLLTVITGHSDVLEMKLGTASPVQNSIAQVKKAAERATALTRQLLAFSRMQVLQPRVFDLNPLVADLGKMLPMLLGEEIEYTFLPGNSLARVKADPSQIEQVLMNLAVNARDAMGRGGKLTIETRNITLDANYASGHPPSVAGEYVRLVVADTGKGMDAQTKARIFEPFFTTKEVGKGTGLGLATVYGIVKQSGGYIWVESTPGQGTRFEIFLPQTIEASQVLGSSDGDANLGRESGTIILAEDEEAVRELACDFLRSSGYTVIAAKDGLEALELAGKHRKQVDILVTDVVMPRMRGTELAQRLKRVYPAIKIVYMSGYLEHNSDDAFISEAEQLQKPFTRDSLLCKLRDARSQVADHERRSEVTSQSVHREGRREGNLTRSAETCQ